MFRHILVATDGSACADVAVAHARQLAERFGARLDAIHVDAGHGHVGRVREQVGAVRRAGIPGRLTVIQSGDEEGALITGFAGRDGADLIVAGMRGNGPTEGEATGRVAQRLLELAPCPVYQVPAPA